MSAHPAPGGEPLYELAAIYVGSRRLPGNVCSRGSFKASLEIHRPMKSARFRSRSSFTSHAANPIEDKSDLLRVVRPRSPGAAVKKGGSEDRRHAWNTLIGARDKGMRLPSDLGGGARPLDRPLRPLTCTTNSPSVLPFVPACPI